MPKSPVVGSVAPDITLPGIVLVDGEVEQSEYTLSAERGHPVLLVFYPGDETAVCTAQLCSYSAELAQFSDLGATVLAVSMQDLASHEKFARKEKLGFPLLADTDGTAVAAYGIGLPGLGLRRSVFLIDAEGVVRWKHVALIGATFQSASTIRTQLERIAA